MSTEHKNYYPLRVDKKYGSAIVSDVDPCRPTYDSNSKQYELNEYGGHIIAESLPPGIAQQLVDVYNEKYAQQSFTPRESSTIQDQIEWITDRKIIVDKKELHIVDAIIENLIAIKRWNQNPLWSQLDLEKVLIDIIQDMNDAINKYGNRDDRSAPEKWIDHNQNAEAALGMLQAFKEKRNGAFTTPTQTPFNGPVSKVEYELINEQFLLDREWVKLTHRRYRYRDTEYFIKLLNAFGTSEENVMWIYQIDQEDGTMYFGKVPDQKQYDLLIQLLEI